jgi:transposase
MESVYESYTREELITTIISLKHELAQIKRMIYGTKSERFLPNDNFFQTTLDLAIEIKELAETQTQTISYTKEKKKSKHVPTGRLPIPSHIERKKIIVEPKEEIIGLKVIGEEVTEELEYTPGKFYVNQYIRKKYVREDNSGIIIAEMPSRPIEKCMAGPGLLASVVVDKYVDHLPLHRQLQRYTRSGMTIPPSTISNWVRATCRLLEPLYDTLKAKVLDQTYLQVDETTIKVQDKNLKGVTHRGYQWVYLAPEIRSVVFDYRLGRGREGPVEMLNGYMGYLQTDAYNAYEIFNTKEITHLYCMAHARRKFDESLANDPQRSSYMLEQMQKLYEVERMARENNYTAEKRLALRKETSIPLLAEIKQWLKDNVIEVLPKSSIGQAIAYCLSRWEKLCLYTNNGKLEIDNNLVENVIRPVALGRKNYLFAGSHDAAQRTAMLYSFTGTCKLNNVEPLQWLTQMLKELPDTKTTQLYKLLPGYIKK